MKNNKPRNFVNKILTKIRNKQQSNKPDEQPEQSRTRITLPYINSTSEMTARLLRPFNVDVAHKPAHKLRSYFTKHKDKTTSKKQKMLYIHDTLQRLSTTIHRSNLEEN